MLRKTSQQLHKSGVRSNYRKGWFRNATCWFVLGNPPTLYTSLAPQGEKYPEIGRKRKSTSNPTPWRPTRDHARFSPARRSWVISEHKQRRRHQTLAQKVAAHADVVQDTAQVFLLLIKGWLQTLCFFIQCKALTCIWKLKLKAGERSCEGGVN